MSKTSIKLVSGAVVEGLINEMEKLLKDFDYLYTHEAVDKIVNTAIENKTPLIKILSQHPNWNPDKLQIVFDVDYTRAKDENGVKNFFSWLDLHTLSFKELLLKRRTVDGKDIFWYEDKVKELRGDYLQVLGDTPEEELKRAEIIEQFDKYRSIKEDLYHNEYEEGSEELLNNLIKIFNLISDDCLEYVSDSLAEKINEIIPELKIHGGQKTTRVVGKICRKYGINNVEQETFRDGEWVKEKPYEREYAKFCDSMNPLTITRHTVLSVNPIDYLTMSFGNSWASCHTIDKNNKRNKAGKNYSGCYSSGTVSYMLDGTSMVYYTVDKSYDGIDFELQDKVTRQMFHWGNNKLVQGRMYPNDQTDAGNSCGNEIYKPVRNIVQKIFATCLDVPNLWYNKKGTGVCNDETYHYGTHYRDVLHYSNCNVSYLKSKDTDGWDDFNHEPITIGHDPICIECGCEHSNEECINCCNELYEGVICRCCGNQVYEDESILIDGEFYCSECVTYCDYHEEYEIDNDHSYTYIEGYGNVCEDGIESMLDSGEIFECNECHELFRARDCVTDVNGNHYCEGCCNDVLVYYEYTDEYFHEDDCVRCDHCDSLVPKVYTLESENKDGFTINICDECKSELEQTVEE